MVMPFAGSFGMAMSFLATPSLQPLHDRLFALSPLINLGTQHDGKECSDLDEKSLTTFGSLNEKGERK